MFEEDDYRRLDFWAIVVGGGLVAVKLDDRERCREWLVVEQYDTPSLDFGNGISAAVLCLGQLQGWEDQFGYSLSAKSRNLDALRDGFVQSPLVSKGRVALEINGAERAWAEDPRWFKIFLSIAQEASIVELALGRHFFSVILVRDESAANSISLEPSSIGYPFRFESSIKPAGSTESF